MYFKESIFYLFIFIIMVWSTFCQATPSPKIPGISCKEISQHERCTILSHKDLLYHYFTLSNPMRVVFDFENSPWDFYNKPQIFSNSLIKNIRYAHRMNGSILRMVFDLNGNVPVTVNQLKNGKLNEIDIDFIRNFRNKIPKFFEPHKVFQNPLSKGRDVIVVIDPGHGGKDPGATGSRGIREKNIVLVIAKLLQKKINQQRGFKSYLTRTGDYYLTLRERLAVARKYRPDMFIAIHADAFPHEDAVGATVYALSSRGATSEAARWLADKENESELMGGVDLNDKSHLLKSVLLDLSQSASIRSSLQMGYGIIQNLSYIGPLHTRKVEQAAFVVLKSPDIPSLLVETGFISNPVEERKLSSENYQDRLANSISRGIFDYFSARPPRDSWLASYVH